MASETLLAAWRAREGFRGEADISTLAFRIAMRRLARYRRQQGKMLVTEDIEGIFDGNEEEPTEPLEEDLKESAALVQAVHSALEKLPPALSEVVHLSFVVGKTQCQIASMLQLPPGTVASRLRRAKVCMRDELTRAAVLAANEIPFRLEAATARASKKKM